MRALLWILRWFASLFSLPPTTDTPEPLPQAPQPQPAPLPWPKRPTDPVDDFTDATVVARTLWGEARGQGAEGMQAVCNVIQNRAANPGWWGSTLRDVCLDHVVEKSGRVVHQFSCWNTFDAEADRMRAPSIGDASYAIADSLALRAVSGRLPDLTSGADHYVAEYALAATKWARDKTPTFVCGKPGSRHYFFKLGLAG